MTFLLNRTRQAITSPTGTGGPLVLSSSAYSNAYLTIADSGGVDQTEYTYIVEEGLDWEIQKGLWSSSGNTLARNTPIQSSIGGVVGTTKLTLAGAAYVRVIADAAEFGSLRGVRAVTGSSDTIANGHSGVLTVYNRSSAIAVSLAAPSSNSFKSGWVGYYKNIGAGAATITATGATLNSDGVSSSAVTLNQYESAIIFSDGTNYYVLISRQPLWIASLGLTSSQQLNAANNILSPSGAGSQLYTVAQKSQIRANADNLRKNYIYNGAMMVSQQNGSTAITTTGSYPVDGFFPSFSNDGATSWQQVASVSPAGSPNRLRITVTSTDTSIAAGQNCRIVQRIEGLRVADLMLGTATAKQVTISWGCKGPAGTYCFSLRNAAGNRAYVVDFVISGGEANTDVTKSVTISLDTSGTWAKDNTCGLILTWALSEGSTAQTTAGSWQAGNYTATSNISNFMGTNANVFELFDVQMVEGSAAPTFLVPDYASELLTCMRYYQKLSAPSGSGQAILAGMAYTSTFALFPWFFQIPMRATPAMSASTHTDWQVRYPSGAAAGSSAITYTAAATSVRVEMTTAAVLTAGQGTLLEGATANAVIHADARV